MWSVCGAYVSRGRKGLIEYFNENLQYFRDEILAHVLILYNWEEFSQQDSRIS